MMNGSGYTPFNPQPSRKQSTSSMLTLDPEPDPPMLRPEQELEDRKHILEILAALRYYHKYANARVQNTECYLNSLPLRHQDMLATYRRHLGVVRDCIDMNQSVLRLIANTVGPHGPVAGLDLKTLDLELGQDGGLGSGHKRVQQDYEKAQSTLKLIARDWSAAGAAERDQCYKLIIDTIEEFFKPGQFAVDEIKILVPGAGLGRLTYELAYRGYECEGNEVSYFMIFASYFILNDCTEENKYTLYPWIHQFANNLQMADQVAAISFPDVCPVKRPPSGSLSMVAGDFLEVYREPNSYDCVATCFFIDCANNVIDFVETIFRILVPGGIWVNLGPLLYHFSNIEPTYENILSIIKTVGFEIVRHESGVCTKYAQNPLSMLKSEYESLFWICRKPLDAKDDADFRDVTASTSVGPSACNGGGGDGGTFDSERH